MRHIKRPSQSFSHSVLHLGAVNKKSIGNMQALDLFSRRAILGRSNKSSVVLEKIAKENSLNRIGAVNFNKYGKQDGMASYHAVTSLWIAFCCMSTSQITS